MRLHQAAVTAFAERLGVDRELVAVAGEGVEAEAGWAHLNTPEMYVGTARGERYDALIEAFVETASRLFPHALLHFEDFGQANARRILTAYRDRARVFNDDIQGTGAITLAAILAGMRVAGSRAADQRVVIFGAGTAGPACSPLRQYAAAASVAISAGSSP